MLIFNLLLIDRHYESGRDRRCMEPEGRKTGEPLCEAIVWDDSRTKNTVAHFEHKFKDVGIQVSPGVWKKGQEGVEALRDM